MPTAYCLFCLLPAATAATACTAYRLYCCLLPTAYMMPTRTGYCLLPPALPAACCLLPSACLLLPAYCCLPTACCLLPATVPPTAYRLYRLPPDVPAFLYCTTVHQYSYDLLQYLLLYEYLIYL